MNPPLVVSKAERKTLGWWCASTITVDGESKPCGTFNAEWLRVHEHCACGGPRSSSRRFLLERDSEDRDETIARASRRAIGILQRMHAIGADAGEVMQAIDRSLDGETSIGATDVELANQAFGLLLKHEWAGSEDRAMCPECGCVVSAQGEHAIHCAWGDLCGLLRRRGLLSYEELLAAAVAIAEGP